MSYSIQAHHQHHQHYSHPEQSEEFMNLPGIEDPGEVSTGSMALSDVPKSPG